MIPTECVPFWAWVATGVFIVPLLQWLKLLPRVGEYVKEWAWLLAPLLSAVAPVVAERMTQYCDKIDPLLWVCLYSAVAYLLSQLVYWLSKKATLIK